MIILRQQSHQYETVKQVINHTVNKEHKYSYLVQWQDNTLTPSWQPEHNCEPIKSLIKAYFQNTNNILQTKFTQNGWDQSTKILKTLSKSQTLLPNSSENTKLKQLSMGVSLLKRKQKQKIINFINELEQSIIHGSPLQRRDHQIDYVEGVFKNKMNRTSFVVRTLQYSKFYIVSLKNMKQHFPRSLKRYFMNLLELNTINQSQDTYLDENESYNEAKKQQVPTRSTYNYSLPDNAISQRDDSDLSSIND